MRAIAKTILRPAMHAAGKPRRCGIFRVTSRDRRKPKVYHNVVKDAFDTSRKTRNSVIVGGGVNEKNQIPPNKRSQPSRDVPDNCAGLFSAKVNVLGSDNEM